MTTPANTQPHYEARDARANSPAHVRYIRWDAEGRRTTQFVCTCEARGANNNAMAQTIAELLNSHLATPSLTPVGKGAGADDNEYKGDGVGYCPSCHCDLAPGDITENGQHLGCGAWVKNGPLEIQLLVGDVRAQHPDGRHVLTWSQAEASIDQHTARAVADAKKSLQEELTIRESQAARHQEWAVAIAQKYTDQQSTIARISAEVEGLNAARLAYRKNTLNAEAERRKAETALAEALEANQRANAIIGQQADEAKGLTDKLAEVTRERDILQKQKDDEEWYFSATYKSNTRFIKELEVKLTELSAYAQRLS